MAHTSSPPMNTNDFIGLPIIITDYDFPSRAPNSSPITTPSTPSSSSSTTIPLTTSALDANRGTGFADFADDLWAKMTQGMKKKLRDACVEVLKRTEEGERGIGGAWMYDDDARFLD